MSIRKKNIKKQVTKQVTGPLISEHILLDYNKPFESRAKKETTRTGLEPAIFARQVEPESNALPLGHQALL
ncbi:hypothetical protein HI914_07548 [Erysiphe necator]|nr:hypothetical protein HI914_07548 [Erysiphe necator]